MSIDPVCTYHFPDSENDDMGDLKARRIFGHSIRQLYFRLNSCLVSFVA
jgi:hypothetical protein